MVTWDVVMLGTAISMVQEFFGIFNKKEVFYNYWEMHFRTICSKKFRLRLTGEMAKWTSSSPSPKVSIREVFNFAIVKSVLSNKCSVHLRTLKMDFGKYFFSKKMSSSSISFNTRNSDVSLSTITFSQSFRGGKLPL